MLFACSLNNEVVLFCVCVVCFLFCNKTKWVYCLHRVVLFPFVLLCFENFVFCSSPKKRPKQSGHSKTTKNKNEEKRDNSSVCAVLFTNSVPILGDGPNNAFLLKHCKILVACFGKGKWPKVSKMLSQKLVEG